MKMWHLHDVNVAMAGWPKACHTLAHGVPWVYNMGFKIWLKACHITYPRFSVGANITFT